MKTIGVRLVYLLVLATLSIGPAAFAQEPPSQTAAQNGTARVGEEIYAGDGCARAGGVAAGDCERRNISDVRPESVPPHGGGGRGGVEEAPVEQTRIETAGETRKGPVPPGDPSEPCPSEPQRGTVETTVEEAVDGDTLRLSEDVEGADTARLIGVDAPEMEGEGGGPEPYAEEAAAFTASQLRGERVLLELDEEPEDEYGRLLAYVWELGGQPPTGRPTDRAPSLFNRALLEGGYVRTLAMNPNTRYAQCFERAEEAAREEMIGLWGLRKEATGGPDHRETRTEHNGSELDASQRTAPEGAESETALPEANMPAWGEGQYEQTDPEEPTRIETSSPELTEGGSELTDEPVGPVSNRPDEQTVREDTVSEAVPAAPEPREPGNTGAEPGSQTFVGPPSEDVTGHGSSAEPLSGDQYAPEEPSVGEETPSTRAPATAGVPDTVVSSLPKQETESGTVPVLPDTGGPGPLALLPLTASVVLVLSVLVRGIGR